MSGIDTAALDEAVRRFPGLLEKAKARPLHRKGIVNDRYRRPGTRPYRALIVDAYRRIVARKQLEAIERALRMAA